MSNITDNIIRILSEPEFDAIGAFLRNWGYTGNREIGSDLVDMLADTDTPTNTLIERFMYKWGFNQADYDGIRTDVQNLFILRSTVHFLPNEVKALESLEGEKSGNVTEKPLTLSEYNKAGKTPREQLFADEADKRVWRYFIGQSGWVWFVHYIVDMPEDYDTSRPSRSLYRAKDGRTTMHMMSLFRTEADAWENINSSIADSSRFDDETLSHVVQLDIM